jgi:hypothetical protein
MALPQTFTGSNGTLLTALDALWVNHAAVTGLLEVQSNKAVVRGTPAASGMCLYDVQPASADYAVFANFQHTATAGEICGVVGRSDKTVSTFYHARKNNGNLQLYKFVNGTATQLGSDVASGYTANTSVELRLDMVGSTIRVLWGGVQKISVTDTSITAIGYGGIRFNTATPGTLDDFDVTNISSAVTHAATGALVSDSATISGTATYNAAHGSSGDLVASAAVISGSAVYSASHGATGDLIAGAALLSGDAARSGSFVTHAANGDMVSDSATISGSSTRFVVHTSSGAMAAGSSAMAGTAVHNVPHASSGGFVSSAASLAATAARSAAGTGSFSTPPMKNNTGTLLASLSGWTVNVFNQTTGALVVQKTGLTTNASGILTISDALIVAGTTYSYEPVHATYGRRLPTALAA